MGHVRSLCFDALEERKLLSTAHGAAHARPAVAATLLVLNGTLTVDNAAATTSMDDEGDTTTSTPVAGQLGSLGEVHGMWNESADQYGDYLGPDTLQLHSATGTLVVAFSGQDTRVLHRLAGGAEQFEHPQTLSAGTGPYARAKESGTIELTTNSARSAVTTMTITS